MELFERVEEARGRWARHIKNLKGNMRRQWKRIEAIQHKIREGQAELDRARRSSAWLARR